MSLLNSFILCEYLSQILWDFPHFVTSCNILAIVEVGRQPEPLLPPCLRDVSCSRSVPADSCSPQCASGGALGASGDFLAFATLVAEECWGHRHRDCVTFYEGSENLNSAPHACVANSLPIHRAPSPVYDSRFNPKSAYLQIQCHL